MKSAKDFSEIYLQREPVDFRKSINGLMVIVEEQMDLSPFCDAVFVFFNKVRDKLKFLYWDQTGFCLWYKRFEKDKFKLSPKYPQAVFTLSNQQWSWLLSSFDINEMRGHHSLTFETRS